MPVPPTAGDNGAAVLTLKEAAHFIRVSDKTLADMARQGAVPAQKVGREWRFLRSALQDWLAGGQPRPGPSPAASSAPGTAEVAIAPAEDAGFRDTDFARNRQEPVHRWVPWIAGFSAAFVDGILESLPAGPGARTVLDPFAGVGTTLVEAMRHGCDAVGFEINPYPALACRLKLELPTRDVGALRADIANFRAFMTDRLASPRTQPQASPPQHFRSRAAFFSPAVERQVLFVLDFIHGQAEGIVADAFRVAFGAVMVGFSNYSYEPSLGRRCSAGKPDILDADVTGIVSTRLEEMADDVEQFQRELRSTGRAPSGRVYTASYLSGCGEVAPGSVDAVITSPPYLNNYHYVRNTRPHLYWLGFVEHPSDLRQFEVGSFGKFWQTVRAGPEIGLEFRCPEVEALVARVAATNGDRGVYGGPGWANYAASYFNDCARFCEVTLRRLKPGGLCVVVIGNNILQGIEVPTDRLLAGIAERAGFELEGIHEVRKKRTGSSIINSSVRVGQTRQRVELYESAVVLRAPRT